MVKNKINISLDLRIISGFLLTVIVLMLFAWMPWKSEAKSDEIIKVTGETVIKSEPDQYVFYPTYQINNVDKTAAVEGATAKSNEIVTKLRELGVAEKDIKISVDGYLSQPNVGGSSTTEEYIYSANITVTVDNKEFAQKIQDYITTTEPLYSVTPQGTFSESKRKELEAKARDEATKDARNKAEQSAKNLGFKVGRVKSVEDGAGFSGEIPIDLKAGTLEASSRDMATTTSLPVNPGENEIRYSVTVTYFVN